MAMDFLSPASTVPDLKQQGESRMNASLAKGMPHGYEVGYDLSPSTDVCWDMASRCE